ncbi:manganese catalase family protein [Micromonospora sp. M12]
MFSHVKDLQFEAKPDGPDAAFARRLQEVLGGKWGELTVANQYLFQGWNCRLPGKYRICCSTWAPRRWATSR